MKVAIIDKRKSLGGTCLNVGCIPSKALLDSSEHFHNAQKNFAAHGIKIPAPKVDLPQMIKRKQEVVDQTTGGIDFLMKKNNIMVHHGTGSFVDATTIQVKGDKTEQITAKHIVIATGSEPVTPPAFGYDGNRVITSTDCLLYTSPSPRDLSTSRMPSSA